MFDHQRDFLGQNDEKGLQVSVTRSHLEAMKKLLFASYLIFALFTMFLHQLTTGQQIYSNDGHPYCYGHTSTSTLGYSCNGPQLSCTSYLTFISTLTHQTPQQIAQLLNSDPSTIASLNGLSRTSDRFLPGREVFVPARCSCSGEFYQHNATYTIRAGDFYFKLANVTFQDLTTCQALISQNKYEPENIPIGARILVPLRCGCPTRNQISSGVRWLMTYVIKSGENMTSIAHRFDTDEQSLLDANPLWEGIIYSYSTVLVPLKSEPGKAKTLANTAPPVESWEGITSGSSNGGSDNKWLFIGIGIVIGFLAPFILLVVWLLHQNVLPVHFRNIFRGNHHDNFDDTSDQSDELSVASSEGSLSRNAIAGNSGAAIWRVEVQNRKIQSSSLGEFGV